MWVFDEVYSIHIQDGKTSITTVTLSNRDLGTNIYNITMMSAEV